jgi:hypothetical protein
MSIVFVWLITEYVQTNDFTSKTHHLELQLNLLMFCHLFTLKCREECFINIPEEMMSLMVCLNRMQPEPCMSIKTSLYIFHHNFCKVDNLVIPLKYHDIITKTNVYQYDSEELFPKKDTKTPPLKKMKKTIENDITNSMSLRKILLDYRSFHKNQFLPPTTFSPNVDLVVRIFSTWGTFLKTLRKFTTAKYKSYIVWNTQLSNKLLNTIINDYEYIHLLNLPFKTDFHIISQKNELNINTPTYNTILRGPFMTLGDPIVNVIEDLFHLKRTLHFNPSESECMIISGEKLWTKNMACYLFSTTRNKYNIKPSQIAGFVFEEIPNYFSKDSEFELFSISKDKKPLKYICKSKKIFQGVISAILYTCLYSNFFQILIEKKKYMVGVFNEHIPDQCIYFKHIHYVLKFLQLQNKSIFENTSTLFINKCINWFTTHKFSMSTDSFEIIRKRFDEIRKLLLV